MRWLDRWQREVVQPDATWYGKILPVHHEMVGNEDAVGQALVDPDEVRYDREHPAREVFYRFGGLPPPDHDGFLKIVVEFETDRSGAGRGRIVTAYVTPVIKAGERLRWRRR